jgi:hypothetical protein
MSRAEQRRATEQQQRGARKNRALWKAWWVYPLAALIAVCVVLGVRSALTPVPDGPPWVVTTNSATPNPDASQSSG